jgi:hypothetical protein
MKLGLIVESTDRGLEALVCPRILELLALETRTKIDLDLVTMTNKILLLHDAVERVRNLLDQGCERIVILWDENPPWTPEKDIGDKRCWHHERDHLLANLRDARIDRRRVRLVCIEREFETWLLHDHQLLAEVISQGPHRAKVKALKDPVRIDDPKAALMSLFHKNKARFNPDVVVFKVRKLLSNLDRLKDCDTFRYFVQEILGNMPKRWKQYNYQPKEPGTKTEQE